MLRSAILSAVLLLPQATQAAYNSGFDMPPTSTGIAGAALNTNPTMTVRTLGYAALTLYIQVTRVAATAVNVSCQAGPTASIQGPISVSNVGAGGSITMAPASWSYPISSSGVVRIIITPVNDAYTTCTISGTGAGAGDVASVYARAAGAP